MVFCDLSTPKGTSDKAEDNKADTGDTEEHTGAFNVYEELKKQLIKKGIPANEIAFIHDAKTIGDKQRLFEQVNAGIVRVIIGSTEKMGAGTNCQKKLVALHHLDCPWRPRDLEQREGRILRRGNENEEVSIYNYVTKGSYDANMWEKVKNKQELIVQALTADIHQRSIEDTDAAVLSYADAEALASGNPLMAEKTIVDSDVKKYMLRKRAHLNKQAQQARLLAKLPTDIATNKENMAKIQADIKARQNVNGDNFSMELNGKLATDRKVADKAFKMIMENVAKEKPARKEIGKIGGFTIVAKTTEVKGYTLNGDVIQADEPFISLGLLGNRFYEVKTPTLNGLIKTLNSAPEAQLEKLKEQTLAMEAEYNNLKKVADAPFDGEEKLQELLKRQAELNEQLGMDGSGKPTEEQPTEVVEPGKEEKSQQRVEPKQEEKDKEEPADNSGFKTTEKVDDKGDSYKSYEVDGVEIAQSRFVDISQKEDTKGGWIDKVGIKEDTTTTAEDKGKYPSSELDGNVVRLTAENAEYATEINTELNINEYKKPGRTLDEMIPFSRRQRAWVFKDKETANEFRAKIENYLQAKKGGTAPGENTGSTNFTATVSSPYQHTQTKENLIKITLKDKVDGDVYKKINALSKQIGGTAGYSRFAKGWLFSKEEEANKFRKAVEEFLGGNGTNNIKYSADNSINKKTPASGVVIKGDEFGEYVDVKDLREKAKEFYRNHLQGTSVPNLELGKIDIDGIVDIDFTSRGGKKSFSAGANINKLLSVKYLRKMLEKASVLTYRDNYKANKKAVGYYTLATTITVDGKEKEVIITLAKTNKGTISYYNHGLDTKKEAQSTHFSKPRPESSPYDEALGSVAVVDRPSSTSNVAEDDREVNNNDVKYSLITDNPKVFNGLTLNDIVSKAKIVPYGELTPQHKRLMEVGEKLGIPVVIVDAPKGLRGWNVNGVTFLNRKANWPLNKVFWHETLHGLMANNPTLYKDFLDYMGRDTITDKQIEDYRKTIHNGDKLSTDEIIEEMMADAMVDVAKRVKLLQDMAVKKPSLVKRMVEFIQDLMTRFTAYLNNRQGGLTTDQKNSMVKAFGRLAASLKDSKGNRLFKVVNGEVQFDNKKFVSISNEEIEQWQKDRAEAVAELFKDSPEYIKRFSADNNVDGVTAVYEAVAENTHETVSALVEEAEKDSKVVPSKNGKIQLVKAIAKKTKFLLGDFLLASPSRLAKKYPIIKTFFTMADNAMRLQNKLRNTFTKRLDDAFKGLSKEEQQALNEILDSGDAQGVEYGKGSQDQVQAVMEECEVNHKVATAYVKIRRVLDDLYDLVNKAKTRYEYKQATVTSNELAKLKENKFIDIQFEFPSETEFDSKGKPKINVEYTEKRNWISEQVVTAEELERMKTNDDIQILNIEEGHTDILHSKHFYDDKILDKMGKLNTDVKIDNYKTYTVLMRESTPAVNKLEGYVPHIFHKYMVYVKDEDGKAVAIGSGRTEKLALEIANQYLDDHPELKDDEKIYIKPQGFDFEGELDVDTKSYAVVLGDMDYSALMSKVQKEYELTGKEARRALEDMVKVKARHRSLGHLKHRTGAQGYEKDFKSVLYSYMNTSTRYHALETEFKPEAISIFERTYGDFNKNYFTTEAIDKHGLEPFYIQMYISKMNGNPSVFEVAVSKMIMKIPFVKRYAENSPYGERVALNWARNITGAVSIGKLGLLNVSSALINYSQFVNTLTYLTKREGIIKSYGRTAKAFADILGGKYKNLTEDEKLAMEDSGVDHDLGMDSGAGYGSTTKALIFKPISWSMVLFNATEKHARRATILAAYRQGRALGMSHHEAGEHAKDINRKSNFEYGVQDNPGLINLTSGTVIGDFALQFQKYPMKEFEVLKDVFSSRTNKKQKLVFFGNQLLLSGVLGLPFSGLLTLLIDSIWNLIPGVDKPFDAEKALKAALMDLMAQCGDNPFARVVIKTAAYGALSNLGIDISKRVGLSDILPGTGPDYNASIDNEFLRGMANYGGASGSTIAQAIDKTSKGDWLGVVKAFSPAMYNIYTAIDGKTYDSKGRVMTEYNTMGERLIHGMGFRTTKESATSDIIASKRYYLEQERKTKQEAIKEFLDAEEAHEDTTKLRKRLKELKVAPNAVKKARKERKLSRQDREIGNNKKSVDYKALKGFI